MPVDCGKLRNAIPFHSSESVCVFGASRRRWTSANAGAASRATLQPLPGR